MGFFEFKNNFELVVNLSKEEVNKKFTSYIKKKRWETISSDEDNISFRTKTTLLSWPIDFDVKLTSNDDNTTILSVSVESTHIDLGRGKGIIHDIINEIY